MNLLEVLSIMKEKYGVDLGIAYGNLNYEQLLELQTLFNRGISQMMAMMGHALSDINHHLAQEEMASLEEILKREQD